jgi:hypothetical protein
VPTKPTTSRWDGPKGALLLEFLATLETGAPVRSTPQAEAAEDFLSRYGPQLEAVERRLVPAALTPDLRERALALLAEEPGCYHVFRALCRQKNFTPVERMHFFFDHAHIEEIAYIRELSQIPGFSAGVDKDLKKFGFANMDWRSGKLGSGQLTALRAAAKCTANRACDSEKMQIALLRQRQDCRERLVDFMLTNEQLTTILSSFDVRKYVHRTLSISHVENQKADAGNRAEIAVTKLLEKKSVRPIEDKTSEWSYDRHVVLHRGPKRIAERNYDFALYFEGQLKAVIEANYFTAPMSKVKEVHIDFRDRRQELEKAGIPFLYVTDGIAYLSLAAELERTFAVFDRDLCNLATFPRRLEQLLGEG